MNLYIIVSNKNIGYDCYGGFVIRAASAERVVQMAKYRAAHEGEEAWDIEHVELLAENVKGEEAEILGDFNAG